MSEYSYYSEDADHKKAEEEAAKNGDMKQEVQKSKSGMTERNVVPEDILNGPRIDEEIAQNEESPFQLEADGDANDDDWLDQAHEANLKSGFVRGV